MGIHPLVHTMNIVKQGGFFMRKLAFILNIFLFITISSGAFANQSDELTDIASVVTEHDLSVDSWEVTLKEEMDQADINGVLQKLEAQNSYKVTSTEDENAVKYLFERVHKKGPIFESYNVVIPKKSMYQAEFSAVIEGEDWNDTIASTYIDRMNDIRTKYFTNKSTKFACITTNIDAKIEDAYFFDQLKQSLQLTNIQTQTDNVEESTVKKIVYGYTPLWEQEIAMEEPMNLQMVVQNNEPESTRLTIGTPILINEY